MKHCCKQARYTHTHQARTDMILQTNCTIHKLLGETMKTIMNFSFQNPPI